MNNMDIIIQKPLLLCVVQATKDNKSPGPDGYTAEFCKYFF